MAVTSVALLAACEKDRDGVFQGADGGSIIQDDGSGQGSGKHVVKTTNVIYNKRCLYNNSVDYTSGFAIEHQFSWSGNNLSSWSSSWSVGDYVYEGGMLKEIVINGGINGGHHSITYTNGLPTEIYTTSNSSTWKRKSITYNNGKVQEINVENNDGNSIRYVLTWSGDNVVRKDEYYNGNLNYNVVFTYDTMNNPEKFDLAVALVFETGVFSPFNELTSMGRYGCILSSNNVTMMTVTHIGEYISPKTYSYTYTYDDDYPVTRVETSRYDNPGGSFYDLFSETTYYEYSDGTGQEQVPQIYTIDLLSNVNMGQLLGGGQYTADSTAVIKADGSMFQQWSDGNTDNPRAITVNANATYTAIFGNRK